MKAVPGNLQNKASTRRGAAQRSRGVRVCRSRKVFTRQHSRDENNVFTVDAMQMRRFCAGAVYNLQIGVP